MLGGFLDIGAVVVQAVSSAAPPANNSGSLALQSCQWLWGPLCTPDGNAFLGVAGLIAGLVAAGYGILLHNRATKTAQDNHIKSEEQSQTIAETTQKTEQITNKSQELLDEVKLISSDIQRLLRHRIFNIGQAMAYAAMIIEKTGEECASERVSADIYYINILTNFGLIHGKNEKFKLSFESLAKELNLKNRNYSSVPTQIADSFHNLRIMKNVREKSILLDSSKFDNEFFETLNSIYPEYKFEIDGKVIQRIIEKEKNDRASLDDGNKLFLEKIDFQMVTTEISFYTDKNRTSIEKIEYYSLVFFVGNQSLEKGQSDPTGNVPIGYYTTDPHYAALDFKVGQWIWDLASTAFRYPVGDSAPLNPVTSASTPPV